MQLNYQELGYVIKRIDPVDLSSQLMSEGHDALTYMEFNVLMYSNLIKTIQRKLRLKINNIYWRKNY
jgi:hypothetical protein